MSADGDRVESEEGTAHQDEPDVEDDVTTAPERPADLEQQQQACALPATEGESHHVEETPATKEDQTPPAPKSVSPTLPNSVQRTEGIRQLKGSVNFLAPRRESRQKKKRR